MTKYISGKEAQLILGITTRQQLHNITKKMNVEIKSQGAGKPNLYLKADIEAYNKRRHDTKVPPRQKPRITKKAKIKKEKVETKKAVRKKQLENKPKQVKKEKATISEIETVEPIPETPKQYKLDSEDFNPLNALGQAEFLRVEQLAKQNGTYEELDQSLLLFYAISYQKYINAVVKSEELDDLTMNEAGDYKIHPYFQVADKCFTHMSKIAVMLGIGVRNRIGLDIKKEKKKSMMDILNSDEEF